MNSKQMNVLSAIVKRDRNIRSLKDEFNITEMQVQQLVEEELVRLDEGQGYCGGIRNLCLTSKGHKFIESYCTACECTPCDCGYGN